MEQLEDGQAQLNGGKPQRAEGDSVESRESPSTVETDEGE